MSRAGSTTNLPHSDVVAPLQGERRLSDDATEKVPQTRTENTSEETSEANVLWVDWDGPGDPMNPKKYVVPLFLVQLQLVNDDTIR